jgi:hypothetical protein
VTDNLFDLGEEVSATSCTSKVRLLKKLAAANNDIANIGDIRTHLKAFGYDEQIILETVNSIMAQSKRLAWSDSVARYQSLDGFQNTKLKLSKAGRFYIEYAMFNLEYVQGVHVDVILPPDATVKHDPRNFSERLRSLELFIRYLHEQDKQEVKRMLLSNAATEYNSIYSASLFSLEIIDALARQVQNVGRSLLHNISRSDSREEIENTLTRWLDLRETTRRDSAQLIQKLENADME